MELLTIFWRTVLFYFVVLLFIRIMGKREVGQLSPFDLVVAIMIAEAAVFAIEDPTRVIWVGVIPVVTLSLLQVIISQACMHSPLIMTLVNGRPAIIIENGKINEHNMRRTRFTIHELLEQLRLKDMPTISDVDYAILEMSGKLSVIPKTDARPVQVSDLNLNIEAEDLPTALIVDSCINKEALQALGRDERWLVEQLQSIGAPGIDQLLVAAVDRKGKIWWQERGQN